MSAFAAAMARPARLRRTNERFITKAPSMARPRVRANRSVPALVVPVPDFVFARQSTKGGYVTSRSQQALGRKSSETREIRNLTAETSRKNARRLIVKILATDATHHRGVARCISIGGTPQISTFRPPVKIDRQRRSSSKSRETLRLATRRRTVAHFARITPLTLFAGMNEASEIEGDAYSGAVDPTERHASHVTVLGDVVELALHIRVQIPIQTGGPVVE
jgi:hypothetical protein